MIKFTSQLQAMLTVLMVLGLVSTAAAVLSCDEARLNCAKTSDCVKALQSYVIKCEIILHESPPNQCPTVCQHALIALMSLDEGKHLMNCECSNEECRQKKQGLKVCKPHVMKAVHNDSLVTCEVAQIICAADYLCTAALNEYHSYCNEMIVGRDCTPQCNNSIVTLRKQKNAAKLDTCACTGKEEYDCPGIKSNMANLCFNREIEMTQENVNSSSICAINVWSLFLISCYHLRQF